MPIHSDDEDPFMDPAYPTATFPGDSPQRRTDHDLDLHAPTLPSRTSPDIYTQLQLPIRKSPDIFARSAARTNRFIPAVTDPKPSLTLVPSLTFEATTPRAHYTSRESPRRESPTRESPSRTSRDYLGSPNRSPHRSPYRSSSGDDPIDLTDLPRTSPIHIRLLKESVESPSREEYNSGSFRLSPSRSHLALSRGSGASSERFLPPPEPIFSPKTFADANPVDSDGASTVGAPEKERDSYDFESYGKDVDTHARSIYSDGAATAYLGSSYVSSQSPSAEQSEYFNASIDGNIMNNINNGYRPSDKKAKTERVVRLVDGQSGHLVLENPIPDELKKVLTRVDSPFGEFTNMTYTACVSNPDDFVADGFTLRAKKYGRETEIVICITMYNEDDRSFARTMHAVMKNVAHLCARHRSSTWGKDAWKKVQVVIVADGRNKISDSVLQLMTATGCYQENLTRPYVNNKKVTAHLFEYTTQISIDENLKFKGDEKNLTPVQVLFCLKEKNQKKINSHRWLFNAFCPLLDPNVIVLLDVGTKPDCKAVYNLWKAFDRDLNVGGAAGEIVTMKGKFGRELLNPLVASQNFEYKMSNILDKPLESVFGYIAVLPGALSAYRYIALKNNDDGTGPLALYFKGESLLAVQDREDQTNSRTNFFEANMYLAEDRILCWELVAKKNESWVLKFVKSATGETDVPDTLPEFLSQRRRWINGALFAAIYSLAHFRQVWKTDHSFVRKFFLHIEFLYQAMVLVFSFFSLANFYLTFYFLTGSLVNTQIGAHSGTWLFKLFDYWCICILTSLFIVSIGNRPQASRKIFKALVIMLTICATYALVVTIYFVGHTFYLHSIGNTSNYVFFTIVLSMLSTYGLYVLMSCLYMDPWHLLTCLIQYFLMIPLYTCTLQIFAFCNTHDVLWGTKGDNNINDENKSNQYIVEQNGEGEYEAVVVNVDVDEVYLESLYNIRNARMAQKVAKAKPAPLVMDGEDYAKDVRSKVVLIWLLSNLMFIMGMISIYEPGTTANNVYLAVILWLVAFLALFRAIGLIAYLIQGLMRRGVETISKWQYKRVSH